MVLIYLLLIKIQMYNHYINLLYQQVVLQILQHSDLPILTSLLTLLLIPMVIFIQLILKLLLLFIASTAPESLQLPSMLVLFSMRLRWIVITTFLLRLLLGLLVSIFFPRPLLVPQVFLKL